jgi:sarcosine oxidase subunit alpha
LPARRLERHPLTPIERGTKVLFKRNGLDVEGYSREPIACALYAANQRVLSRSMRYHRARGLFCGTGNCTHCFQSVNGIPNVRTCQKLCGKLDWVEDQNAWPDAERDVLAAADLAFPNYLNAHEAFIRPKFLKPLYTKIIRGMAGFGKVPRTPVPQTYRAESTETDICVVGAGIAGLAAAEAAASTGLHVLLLEREERLGGRLQHLPTPFHGTTSDAPKTEGKAWAILARNKLDHSNVTIRTQTTLFGIYEGNRIACTTPRGLLDVHARAFVLAPGAYDAYEPFPGSDRAGVLLATAAQRLLNLYGVVPGDSVVIVGASRDGLLLARDLHACGARIHAITDPRPEPGVLPPLAHEVEGLGVPILWNHRAVGVKGRRVPRGLFLEGPRVDKLPCETIILATGRRPSIELLQQAGCALEHKPDQGGFVPRLTPDLETSVSHVFAGGSAAGLSDEWGSHLSGRLAGLGALHSLSLLAEDDALEQARDLHRDHRRRLPAPRLVAA